MARGRESRDRSRRSSGHGPPDLQQSPAGQHGGPRRRRHQQDSRPMEWRPRASSSSLARPASLTMELQPSSSSEARPAMQPALQPSSSSPALPALQRALQPSSSSPACPASLATELQPSSSSQPRSAMQPALQPSSSSPARPASQRSLQPSSSSQARSAMQPALQPSPSPSRPALQPSPSPARPALQPSSSSTTLSTLQPESQPSSSSTARPTFEPPASWPQQRPVPHLNPQAACYNAWPQGPPSLLPNPSWLPVFLPYPPLNLWPESLAPLYLQQLYYQQHQRNPQQLYYLQPFLLSSGHGRPLLPQLRMIDPSARPHIPLFVQAQGMSPQHWPPQTQFQLPSAPAIRAPPNYNLQDEMPQQQTMRNAALERYWAAYEPERATNRVEYPIQEFNTDGTEEQPETDAAPIKNGSESALPQQ